MGKIIKVKTKNVRPSQDFLKEDTLRHILDCYKNGKDLPPMPIVISDFGNSEKFIAIDGHNLLAVKGYLREDCEVYVASSADDCIQGEGESIEKRNLELKNNFDSVFEKAENLKKEGLDSFEKLRRNYSILKEKSEIKMK